MHLAVPQVAVVVMCLVSIILYRAIMAILVSRSDNTLLAAWVSPHLPSWWVEGAGPPIPHSTLTTDSHQASRIASFTGSVVNLVFILILSKIYVALAHILTRWGEWPRLLGPDPGTCPALETRT